MKPSTTLALTALCSLVAAQPMIEKRDGTTNTVTDWVTVVVDVYETVDSPAGSTGVASNQHDHMAYHSKNKAESQPQLTSSTLSPPAPTFQQKAAYVAPPVTTTPPAPSPPTGSTPAEIQSAEDARQDTINQQQVKVNNQQKEADFNHQSQMISLQNGGVQSGGQLPTSPPVVPQAPASSVAQAPVQSQGPSTPAGGNGGSCGSVGGQCSGDVTIYNDAGAGACGWTNDTNSEDFFALAAPMFGTYTNDAPGPHKNAYCGRMATIQVNGKSFTGMLTDKCGGCVGESIDLSQHLFSQLYPNQPPGNGRYHDVPWQFTSEPSYNGAS